MQGEREHLRRLHEVGTLILAPTHVSNLDSVILGFASLQLGLPPVTYGAANQVSALLGLGMYRELAPVLTGLLFIGRAGSSIAAELGLMRATDQITALSLMGIDPVGKAVAPRFWAAVLSVPLLTGFFCSFGILASYRTSPFMHGKQHLLYGLGCLFIMGLGLRNLTL